MIVRLKGVKVARAKGKVYYYHRKTNTRLPGQPGSAEFIAAVRDLDARHSKAANPGTLAGLIEAYRASPEFAALAPATRHKYGKVFEELRKIEVARLANITPEWLYAYRDKKARERKRAVTNMILAVLKMMFNWGIKRGKCKANPVAAVERIRRPRGLPVKNRPYRPEELSTVLAEAPDWLRRAVAVAAYTGLRESDVVKVKWTAYDGRAFETRAQKTGALVWVPAHSRLREILDAAPRTSPTIVAGVRGHEIGRSTLTTAFFSLLRRLRDEGKVGSGLSFHGLRHTLGTALAEAGCDPPTIAAALGQATTQMAEHYSRTANRRELVRAGFDKLEQGDRI